jgi:hypothetical protein
LQEAIQIVRSFLAGECAAVWARAAHGGRYPSSRAIAVVTDGFSARVVDHTDDQKRLVFGGLDNEPVNDYSGKVKVGSQLAVSYDNVREHKKPSEFVKQ